MLRADTGYHTCYRCGGQHSCRPIGALPWLRVVAERDNNTELGHMTATKPRPLLAPGETRAYPVLPLRDIVVLPHMIAALFVGRKKSILALEEATRSDTFILLATQKERVRRRAGARGHLRDRHACERAATAQAPRRHR